MKTNVKVNIDPKLIAKRTPKADHILALQAAKDTEKFAPKLTGKMRLDTKVEGARIIYPPPAGYLYRGKLMVDLATGSPWASKGATKVLTDRNLVLNHPGVDPDAQDHWFEASKALNMDKWERVYGRALASGK